MEPSMSSKKLIHSSLVSVTGIQTETKGHDNDRKWNKGKVASIDGNQMHEFNHKRTFTYISQNDHLHGRMTLRKSFLFVGCYLQSEKRYFPMSELTRKETNTGTKRHVKINVFIKSTAMAGERFNLVSGFVLKIRGLDTNVELMVGTEMSRVTFDGQMKCIRYESSIPNSDSALVAELYEKINYSTLHYSERLQCQLQNSGSQIADNGVDDRLRKKCSNIKLHVKLIMVIVKGADDIGEKTKPDLSLTGNISDLRNNKEIDSSKGKRGEKRTKWKKNELSKFKVDTFKLYQLLNKIRSKPNCIEAVDLNGGDLLKKRVGIVRFTNVKVKAGVWVPNALTNVVKATKHVLETVDVPVIGVTKGIGSYEQIRRVALNQDLIFILDARVIIDARFSNRTFSLNMEVRPNMDLKTKFYSLKRVNKVKPDLEELDLQHFSHFARLGVEAEIANGSELDENFQGLGTRRVKNLLVIAKKCVSCIIFIEGIDATWYNCHIIIPNLDFEEWRQNLESYMAKVQKTDGINMMIIAKVTPNFFVIEPTNLVNVAALRAVMNSVIFVIMADIDYDKGRVNMGSERKIPRLKRTDFNEGSEANSTDEKKLLRATQEQFFQYQDNKKVRMILGRQHEKRSLWVIKWHWRWKHEMLSLFHILPWKPKIFLWLSYTRNGFSDSNNSPTETIHHLTNYNTHSLGVQHSLRLS